MTRFYFLIILCTVVARHATGQDKMYRIDHTVLEVKILEVGEQIKYKPWDNLDGPVYSVSRGKIHRIEYQNGVEEIITVPRNPATVPTRVSSEVDPWAEKNRRDSLHYFGHDHNLSLNFFSFFNNEIGLLYTREFFRSNFSIVVPLGFGLQAPSVTNAVYFPKESSLVRCDRKIYEVGLGANYYPVVRAPLSYYVGPVLRYQKYDAIQSGWIPRGPPGYGTIATKDVTLSRFCFSLTNGIMVRTRSRLTFNTFASLGFCSDVIDNPLTNAATGEAIPLDKPLWLYFWSGFNMGFNF